MSCDQFSRVCSSCFFVSTEKSFSSSSRVSGGMSVGFMPANPKVLLLNRRLIIAFRISSNAGLACASMGCIKSSSELLALRPDLRSSMSECCIFILHLLASAPT